MRRKPTPSPLVYQSLVATGLFAAGLLSATPALAVEEDIQLWGYLEVSAPVADDWTVSVETSPRLIDAGDQLESRLQLKYKAASWLDLGGGVIHNARPGGNEIRPFQQFELKFGPFEARTRMEERFFSDQPRTEWRFRQRVSASQDLTDTTSLTGDVELFYIIHARAPEKLQGVEDWRFTLSLDHKITDNFSVNGGYMMILSPNGDEETSLSHVPQLGVKYSF